MDDALFHIDGDTFVPTDLARGPWTPDAQHGGPPCALLTRSIESVSSLVPMQLARVTFELLRPVPIAPLRITTEVLRDGKKVQLVGASLRTDDAEVVRAVAVRIRTAAMDVPAEVNVDDGRPDIPDTADDREFPFAVIGEHPAFHRDGVEIRTVAGGFERPGPGTAWFRLKVPVVAGEEPSGAMRAVATADFGNGLAWMLPPDWLFINPDLSVHLLRPPVGEWICLAARTLPSSTGVGIAESAIYDDHGRVGRAVQSLLLDESR